MTAGPEPDLDLEGRVRQMLAGHAYGFLVTIGMRPHARLVQHLLADEGLDVWIGTSPASRKVAEAAEGWATYALEDRPCFAAVSLSGPVTVVDAPDLRTHHWAEGFDAFFPDGPLGDDYVLLHLVPNEIELIDFANGIHPDPYGLASQRFSLVDGGWHPAGTTRSPPS